MNTSQTGFLSEILAGGKINKATLGYFRERLRNRIHQFILREFMAKQREGLTQADIARILNRRPEQINRWLGNPGNLEIDTISDLILAISKAELDFKSDKLEARSPRNYRFPEWIKVRPVPPPMEKPGVRRPDGPVAGTNPRKRSRFKLSTKLGQQAGGARISEEILDADAA